ncbi:hypothetical protein [Granulicella arctica]|nr:hypothetical protein [Granulicella arctica]
MTYRSYRPNALSRWSMLLAVLCIGLLLVGSTVQASHTHLSGTASHSDCSLCVTAHVGIVATALLVALVISIVVSLIEAASPVTRSVALFTFALFTRPPPDGCVFA